MYDDHTTLLIDLADGTKVVVLWRSHASSVKLYTVYCLYLTCPLYTCDIGVHAIVHCLVCLRIVCDGCRGITVSSTHRQLPGLPRD